MINIAGQLHAATDEGVLVSSAEVPGTDQCRALRVAEFTTIRNYRPEHES